jgi:hypothetical protein
VRWLRRARVTVDASGGRGSPSKNVGDESKPPSKKKRKLQADSEEADSAAVTVADPEITLRVACLDGSSLDLKVPPRELVREVKRAIGQVRRRLVTCRACSRQ